MFGPDFLMTPEIEGGIDGVAALITAGHVVHLVSKCGPGVQRKTEMWLDARDVFTRTGLPAENVHFVRQRPDKAPVADRLGLDAFVDDRLDVLTTLRGRPHARVVRAAAGRPQAASRRGDRARLARGPGDPSTLTVRLGYGGEAHAGDR